MDRLAAHRAFFASLITASLGEEQKRLWQAFQKTPREHFVGKGPWKVLTGGGYIETPSDDPSLIYQDILVALAPGGINNGQPSLHALCLAALKIRERDVITHVGAGTGYYTAILSQLTGEAGSVAAYEIDSELAQRAACNLAAYRNVAVHCRSGSAGSLPQCDVLYVNAGATAPLDVWLDALRPGGRLLFPLTPTHGAGAMLLITRTAHSRFEARFHTPALFIPCLGARDEDLAKRLTAAFKRDDTFDVRSLRRGTEPDESCWFSAGGCWLSTSEERSGGN